MKTVLYGINAATDVLTQKASASETLLYVTTKGEETYQGHRVHSLEGLASQDFNQIERLIICSIFVTEITTSLLEVGFPLSKIHFFNLVDGQIHACRDQLMPSIERDDVLYAFYDLSRYLATFDIVAFCALSELERLRLNKKYIHFVIVPNRSFSKKYVSVTSNHDEVDQVWRIHHILMATMSCVPSMKGITNLAAREEAAYYYESGVDCFPENYSLQNNKKTFHQQDMIVEKKKGKSLSLFVAPPQAKQLINSFLEERSKGRKVIVITLREYNIQTTRNSQLDEWAAFVNQLDREIYYPVIIRDTMKSAQPLPDIFMDVDDCPLAAIDLTLRVALYERAYINLSTSTGPSYMFFFIPGIVTIDFLPISQDNPANAMRTLLRSGHVVDEDYILRDNDYQRFVWRTPDAQIIQEAFDSMVNDLESRDRV